MHKIQRKDLGKLQKQAINSCNRKQFLTVPKLGGFGVIRKFRVTELKLWSKEVWIWFWTNLEIWKIQKVNVTGSLDRWKQDETTDASFI